MAKSNKEKSNKEKSNKEKSNKEKSNKESLEKMLDALQTAKTIWEHCAATGKGKPEWADNYRWSCPVCEVVHGKKGSESKHGCPGCPIYWSSGKPGFDNELGYYCSYSFAYWAKCVTLYESEEAKQYAMEILGDINEAIKSLEIQI